MPIDRCMADSLAIAFTLGMLQTELQAFLKRVAGHISLGR